MCQYYSSKSKLGDRVHLLHQFRKAINYFLLARKLYHLNFIILNRFRAKKLITSGVSLFSFRQDLKERRNREGEKLETPSLSLLLRDWDLAKGSMAK